tara:strand:- start:781 stop:999 length:219 start_codon:yes stop_codon:yes gene_type:complete
MARPKNVENWVYPVVKTMFVKYLSTKHDKPFNDIRIADMSDEDILIWKNIEKLNGVNIGVSFADNTERRVLH